MLDADPAHPDALHLLGLLAQQSGDAEEARRLIGRAIEHRPEAGIFHFNLGVVQQSSGLLEEAAASYRSAMIWAPGHVDAYNNLGVVLQGLGRQQEAASAYEDALRLDPSRFDVWFGLAAALQVQDRLQDAEAAYRQALQLRPADARCLSNLGTVLRKLGQSESAEECYRNAIAAEPQLVDAHHNLGNVLRDQCRYEEALAAYQAAIDTGAASTDVFTHRGNVLQDVGRMEEAVASYQRALELDSLSTEAWFNLGTALQSSGHPEEAIRSYERALELDPKHADAHFGLAMPLLRRGEFDRGWPEYEWRWKSTVPGRELRDIPRPDWQGDALEGRVIFIEAEQGLGDAMHFVRYVPLVEQKGGRVILECRPELRRLFEHSFPTVQVASEGDTVTDFDVRAQLMSLPRIFGTRVETIPNSVPYLQPDPMLAQEWRPRIKGNRLKVGLVWATNTPEVPSRERLLPPPLLAELGDVAGVRFYSLQVGQAAANRPALDLMDLAPDLSDFAETAAAVSLLDLVISVDTSVAHLAGALARPVWIVLPAVAEWRWLENRSDSPWYPTARLFRQSVFGDWASVIADIRRALHSIVGASGGS